MSYRMSAINALFFRELKSVLRIKSLWLVPIPILWLALTRVASPPDEYSVSVLGSDYVLASLQNPLIFVVPIAAVFLGYRAVVGELESGSLKLTVATPIDRRSIVPVKIGARALALSIPVLGSILVTWLVGGQYLGYSSPVTVGLFALVTVLYVLVNVSVAVGVSAMVATGARAVTSLFGYLVVMIAFWAFSIAPGLLRATTGSGPNGLTAPHSELAFFLRRLSPRESYIVLLNWVLGVGNTDELAYHYIRQTQDGVNMLTYNVDDTFESTHSILLSEWFPLVLSIAWIGLFLTLGMARLNNRDIGYQ